MTTILGTIPFAASFLWMAFIFTLGEPERRSWRWSFALSATLIASFTLVMTEGLSLFADLHLIWVTAGWICFSIIPLGLVWRRRSHLCLDSLPLRIKACLRGAPAWAVIFLASIMSLIAVMAAATPPLNFDVQIYHLPRQVFWMFNNSVSNFPASNSHSLSMPPLSEFIGLHLMILSGGDMWHNLVQTFYLLGCCAIISRMISDLGGGGREIVLGLLTTLLVPVVFFEGSNSKNDIIVAFFILLPTSIALRTWVKKKPAGFADCLLAAWSAGLAVATKGTAVAYLPAAGLFLAVAIFIRGNPRILLLSSIPGVLLALLPSTPHMLRNLEEFGSPAGPNLHHSNASMTPADIFGVAARNIAGQFATGFPSWNEQVEKKTRSLLSAFNIDPNDPATTFEGAGFNIQYYPGLEDLVSAPVQTTLLLLLPTAFFFNRFRNHHGVIPLTCVLVGSLALFCTIFRWQPWQGRLLIPAFLLASPLLGVWQGNMRQKWIPMLCILLATATLQPHITYAGQRPLLGAGSIFRNTKTSQMSRMIPGRSQEIKRLVEFLNAQKLSRIIIDGGSTEIYGLLREISNEVNAIVITSGKKQQYNCENIDALVIPSIPYAGVPPPPANVLTESLSDFSILWIGDYYKVYVPEKKGNCEPIMAAHFSGFSDERGLSPYWFIQGNLETWGREVDSSEVLLRPLHSGKLQLAVHSIAGNKIKIEQNGREIANFSFESDYLEKTINIDEKDIINIKVLKRPAWIQKIVITEGEK